MRRKAEVTSKGPGVGPRVARRRTGAVVAGVAGGIADHLGVSVFRVRLVFVVLAALSGAGFVAYGLLWVFCAPEPRRVAREVPARERQQGVGMAVLGIGLSIAVSALGDQVSGWVAGPLGIALVGVVLVWREADTETRPRWWSGRAGAVRLISGALLVAGGIIAFLLGRVDLSQVQFGLLAAFATLTGVVVLTVPWWLRLVRELTAERRARIREQERAEIAAHLHDSVLQTLALIQKQSGEDLQGREVRRLARRQERELRTWLYGLPGQSDTSGKAASSGVAAAMSAVAAEVEDAYGLRVAPVVVGDAPLTGDVTALVAAAREAVVNAAKHSGAEEISVYVEAGPDTVEVFVRDRGRGFDPDAVPADRQGLAGSVRARMARHGGRTRLRTAPGEGTEVGLSMPRRQGPDDAGGTPEDVAPEAEPRAARPSTTAVPVPSGADRAAAADREEEER